MKVLSCYKKLTSDNMIAGGIGQGGGLYWQESVGVLLQAAIAQELGANLFLSPREHGLDSYDRHPYDIDPDHIDSDIAYLQLFEVPRQRPKRFVYSIVSDYIGMEELLEDFLAQVRPNLIISFQYPLMPYEMVHGLPEKYRNNPPNLVSQCNRHGCDVVYLPWFNVENKVYNPNKINTAMCSGKLSGTYPKRDAIYHYLEALNRPDIILSGNPTGSIFKLSDDEYHAALYQTKYNLSGGIFDIQIPPKYYEICNYGACLVSHDMPMMAESGFVPDETYIQIGTLDEIPSVLESDRWREIAPAGQKMVHERHLIQTRAREIADLFLKWRHNATGQDD